MATTKRSTAKLAKTPRGTSGATAKQEDGAGEVDAYLARLPEPSRSTLTTLRQTIRAAAPRATERISYGIPSFQLHGMLLGYGAAAKHCALYGLVDPMPELAAYDTAKGTIRFAPDAPLPARLVRKIVKARIARNEARALATKPARQASKRMGPGRVGRSADAR